MWMNYNYNKQNKYNKNKKKRPINPMWEYRWWVALIVILILITFIIKDYKCERVTQTLDPLISGDTLAVSTPYFDVRDLFPKQRKTYRYTE